MNQIYDPILKAKRFGNFLEKMKAKNVTEYNSDSDSDTEMQFLKKRKSKLKRNPKVKEVHEKKVATQSSLTVEEDLEIHVLDSESDTEKVTDTKEYKDIELIHETPIVDEDLIRATEITMENSDVLVFIQDRIAMKKEQLSIRRHEPFKKIFSHFAELHQTKIEDIYLDYEGRPLSANDTVYSINYHPKHMIDVSRRHKTNNFDAFSKDEPTKKIKNMISLKFQCLKVRRPIMVSIKSKDLMKVAMAIACEQFDLDPRRVRFYFDGDKILYSDTVKSLDLTTGDIIDIKDIHSKNDSTLSE